MSNIDKALLKIGTIDDLGEKLDDTVKGFRNLVHNKDGGVEALQAALKQIRANVAVEIKKDIDEGKIDLEKAAEIKNYVATATGTVGSLIAMWAADHKAAQGQVAGMEEAMKIALKMRAGENAKIEKVKRREEEEKAQEEAEEAEKAKKKATKKKAKKKKVAKKDAPNPRQDPGTK